MDSIEKAKVNEEVLKQFEDIWQGAYRQGYIQGKSEGLKEGMKAIERIFNTQADDK